MDNRQAPGSTHLISQRKWLRGLAIAVVSALVAVLGARLSGGSTCQERSGRSVPKEIFEGITYGCEWLEPSDEGRGIIYWVRVDLTAPGIELYVTPKDPTAVSRGWQYRLRWVGDVVRTEDLAVAINATYFTTNSSWRPQMSGDLANGVETVVSNHVVSHLSEHTYLLWFDDRLTPHLQTSKPPTAAALVMAKWAIGGQAVWLRDGEVWSGSNRSIDCRTAVAIDPSRKLLFLAVSASVSPRLILQKLADLGGKDGMLLDGGSSSSMAIGKNAEGIPGGVILGGWQPVATHFGIRAWRLGTRGKRSL
jgi:hypothetical protein